MVECHASNVDVASSSLVARSKILPPSSNGVIMKKCSKCKIEKHESAFFKDNKMQSGLQSQCKQCKSKGIMDYYHKNPHKRSKPLVETIRKKMLKTYYNHRVEMNFSRQMRQCLGGNKNGRHWESLVGYTLEDLKRHLENQFKDGMSWENYGKWHIDHIKPKSSFKFQSTENEEFKRCWSLDNLQPLWAKDNLIKSNK